MIYKRKPILITVFQVPETVNLPVPTWVSDGIAKGLIIPARLREYGWHVKDQYGITHWANVGEYITDSPIDGLGYLTQKQLDAHYELETV